MSRINLGININAAPEKVFDVVADIENSRARAEGIEGVEMLVEGTVRVGTKWRETHNVNNRQSVEEMEVTAFERPHFYSTYCDSHGFDVEATTRVAPQGDGSTLMLDMTSRPRTFVAKLMSPVAWLMTGMMKKMVLEDLENLKAYIEQQGTPA